MTKKTTTKRPHAVQVTAARAKSTTLLTAPGIVRLLDKTEIVAIAGVSFPTIWGWQRAGTFPRARIVGGKSMWLSTEVEQWLVALPVRKLKGDKPEAASRHVGGTR